MNENTFEIQRLKSNINAVRQIRFQYENKVFQYGMSPDYFKVVLQEISTKKVQFLSFALEMHESWTDNYSDEVKKLFTELKKMYRDTADFFSELHKMATDNLEESKMNEPNIIKENILQKKKNVEDNDWFKVGLKFADGTIKYETFHNLSFNKITTNAGLSITLRPYVSTTYNNTKGSPKNIFNNKNKMTKIYEYCIAHNIDVSQWFLNEYKKFED